MSSPGLEDRSAQRFTRVFLLVLLLGLSMSAAAAIVVDPIRTFNTGWVPPILTGEFETKPVAFLTIEPPRTAVVLGTSSVGKFRPACIEELTGLPSFNFGLNGATIDDIATALRFIRARSRVPIRELIIGVDVESFNRNATPALRQRWAVDVHDYVDDGAQLSFDAVTRTLFGWKMFRHAGSSVWHHLQGDPIHVSYADDGFITYNIMEAQMRAGTFTPEKKDVDVTGFTALPEPRVARFREMIAAARADGTEIDAFIPPIGVRNRARLAARTRDLDALLTDLERRGMIRYFRVARIEDVGGDPAGYFDGLHMVEANASRLLLAMFHRSHGCGI